MTDQERAVMQQALEALRVVLNDDYKIPYSKIVNAVIDLDAALAQEQEPDDEPTYCPTCGVEDGGTTCGMPNCGLRCGAEQEQPEPVQEPVAWIQPDHLQKARVAPFFCRVEPTQRCADFVPLYTAPPQQPEPVQEPVAWMYPDDYAGILKHQSRAEVFQKAWCNPAVCVPLYTAPPCRLPLTDDEIDKATAQERDALLDHIYEYGTAAEGVLERIRKLCRAVERRVRGETE